MKNIRFGAVYSGPPIFCADLDEMGYFSPEDLKLPQALVQDINIWNIIYQNTFCESSPQESGFNTYGEMLNHNLEGEKLAIRMQIVLGSDVNVLFIPVAK